MSGSSSEIQVLATLEALYWAAIVVSLFFSGDVDSSLSTIQKAVSKETSAFIPFCDVIKPHFGTMIL